jgi:hypothetical protein
LATKEPLVPETMAALPHFPETMATKVTKKSKKKATKH